MSKFSSQFRVLVYVTIDQTKNCSPEYGKGREYAESANLNMISRIIIDKISKSEFILMLYVL